MMARSMRVRQAWLVFYSHAGERVFRVFSAGGGHRGFRDGNVLAAFHHEFIAADA